MVSVDSVPCLDLADRVVPEYKKLRNDYKASPDISEYQSSQKISRFYELISDL